MQIPSNIQFENNCEALLRKSLLAALPYEGCALLLGKQSFRSEKILYQISSIWPCENIWRPGIKAFEEPIMISNKGPEITSRRNRFAIDPIQHLKAQKWARAKNLLVLGSAHSHPDNLPIPSKTDLAWNFSNSLMLILGSNGVLKAWWIKNGFGEKAIEITWTTQGHNI